MSEAELKAEIERLQAENAAMKKTGVSFQVSQKGAVSIYGLGSRPFTLYKEQWERVLNGEPEIRAFMQSHDAELK